MLGTIVPLIENMSFCSSFTFNKPRMPPADEVHEAVGFSKLLIAIEINAGLPTSVSNNKESLDFSSGLSEVTQIFN